MKTSLLAILAVTAGYILHATVTGGGRETITVWSTIRLESSALRTASIGSVLLVAGDATTSELPSGWIPCDGRIIGAARHPALHRVLSGGTGERRRDALEATKDGVRLPDFRGIVLGEPFDVGMVIRAARFVGGSMHTNMLLCSGNGRGNAGRHLMAIIKAE